MVQVSRVLSDSWWFWRTGISGAGVAMSPAGIDFVQSVGDASGLLKIELISFGQLWSHLNRTVSNIFGYIWVHVRPARDWVCGNCRRMWTKGTRGWWVGRQGRTLEWWKRGGRGHAAVPFRAMLATGHCTWVAAASFDNYRREHWATYLLNQAEKSHQSMENDLRMGWTLVMCDFNTFFQLNYEYVQWRTQRYLFRPLFAEFSMNLSLRLIKTCAWRMFFRLISDDHFTTLAVEFLMQCMICMEEKVLKEKVEIGGPLQLHCTRGLFWPTFEEM